MAERIEFGSKAAADSFREEDEDHLCSDDDRRFKTVAISSDAPEWVLEEATIEAAAGRNERGSRGGQVELTDHERDSSDPNEWDYYRPTRTAPMTIIAEISIRADQFLLGQIIAEHDGLLVELERVVPADKRIMPYIWGYGSDLEAFEAAMAESPNVESITALDQYDDRALYKILWEDPAEQLITGITRSDATILEAHSDEEWIFRIRFEDHSGLAQFNRYCADHDIRYQLNRVSSLSEQPPDGHDFELTDAQYDALVLAAERGYFKVPREVGYDELADELEVSVQALSERVRRGADKVLRAALLHSGAGSSEGR